MTTLGFVEKVGELTLRLLTSRKFMALFTIFILLPAGTLALLYLSMEQETKDALRLAMVEYFNSDEMEKASILQREGVELLKSGRYEEAIGKFREAKALLYELSHSYMRASLEIKTEELKDYAIYAAMSFEGFAAFNDCLIEVAEEYKVRERGGVEERIAEKCLPHLHQVREYMEMSKRTARSLS